MIWRSSGRRWRGFGLVLLKVENFEGSSLRGGVSIGGFYRVINLRTPNDNRSASSRRKVSQNKPVTENHQNLICSQELSLISLATRTANGLTNSIDNQNQPQNEEE